MPIPIQPTIRANCWAKTSLLVPNDSRCPVTTLVTRTHRDKPDRDRDGAERQELLAVQGEGLLDGGLRSDKSFTLATWGGRHGSPVLKQLFAWMFKDQAQDQAPGIRKLQSMPGRSPAERKTECKSWLPNRAWRETVPSPCQASDHQIWETSRNTCSGIPWPLFWVLW